MCSPLASWAAEFEVRSPIIDVREFEYDFKLARGFDRSPGKANARGVVHEFEFGVSAWWSPAIEGEWTREAGPDQAGRFRASTLENRFQLAEHGEYWIDAGLFVEYEHGARNGNGNALRVGPLLRKDYGPVSALLNVLAVKEYGRAARGELALSYAWQARWMWREEFQPGLEGYGGVLESGVSSPRQHLVGPVAFGGFDFGERQDVRYEMGYLRGLDNNAPRGTWKLLVGYEYRF